MGIQIGLVGISAFAQSFIPLFKAHPWAAPLVRCHLDADKLAANAAKLLVDDFVKPRVSGQQPPNHVWAAS